MTTLCRAEPILAAVRPRAEAVRMLATAARGDIVRELRRPWPVFLVNEREHPDARPLISQLIADGLLAITHPEEPTSPVMPTVAGRSRIGAFA